MRRVVCDTGPLLHLREAGFIELLKWTGTIAIPPAVYSELVDYDPFWQESKPEWVRLESIDPTHSLHAARWQQAGLLDPGEAEALALAHQIRAAWFLTDDAAARLIAQQQGFEVHGSLGIVLWAAVSGRLLRTDAERAIEALYHSSLWVSARVVEEARAAIRQIFS